ncbi:MAG TPA: hypothetical protein VGG38_18500 [Acidimicrobiales bacterium]
MHLGQAAITSTLWREFRGDERKTPDLEGVLKGQTGHGATPGLRQSISGAPKRQMAQEWLDRQLNVGHPAELISDSGGQFVETRDWKLQHPLTGKPCGGRADPSKEK